MWVRNGPRFERQVLQEQLAILKRGKIMKKYGTGELLPEPDDSLEPFSEQDEKDLQEENDQE